MRILGIDPGLANTGWAIVDFNGQKYQPVSYGTIHTKAEDEIQLRVSSIAEKIRELVRENKVEQISVEDIFFAKNEVSAMGVAKVIGALTYAAFLENLNLSVFSPLQIKMAITGNGRADKKQVQEMCRLLLGLKTIPRPDHAADALAVSVCYGNISSTYRKLGIMK